MSNPDGTPMHVRRRVIDRPELRALSPIGECERLQRAVIAVLDMLAGADDGDQTADMLRLAAEYLDGQGFGGPLSGKLRAKAARIESVLLCHE